MTTLAASKRPAAVSSEELLNPCWAEVTDLREEIDSTFTVWLKFKDPALQKGYAFEPGQFNMLYLPGYGEAAISICSDPEKRDAIGHTVRAVGNVTRAIGRMKKGDEIGLRGPFGTHWPIEQLEGRDILLAAGGIGLPPLRPAVYHILHNRAKYGKVILLYGARSPSDLLYTNEFEAWRKSDIDVQVTVDRADDTWKGQVGVVPLLFYRFRLDPAKTAVMTCGPEIMIRFVVFEALARRIPADRIYVSLERNMKCGQGFCGHCQLGPFFVCKDGPVFPYSVIEPYFGVEEF
ncbi:MAG: FAD/NAD(P)-binding protein [Anaerolineales bacterium]|nr:FAD/NAD(P)-binding protein [Anaerolineales bacterium]